MMEPHGAIKFFRMGDRW